VKTPEPVVAAVSREVAEALRDPAIGEKLKALYMEPLGTSRRNSRRMWTPR